MLGPLLFNIFLNDLFYFINRTNLSNYADDNQIYFSDRDPEVVKSVINGDLAVASRWFDDNKLVLNPEKCKCIILPKNCLILLTVLRSGIIVMSLISRSWKGLM